jgi:SAM-dependent methyltransferase
MESEPSQSDSQIAVFSTTLVLPGQTPGRSSPQGDSPIAVFSTLYRRVCELVVGTGFLDAGCSSGFLPLVVAERLPSLTNVVGVDIRPDPFTVARAIAAERHLANVQFAQADLLVPDLSSLGRFDTVTVLHVLEHFSESDMYHVLTNLLKVTDQRLIIAVPYEPGEPEAAYGHEQLFTRSRLEGLGQWCLDQLGAGQFTCEDCAGGLLLIDRYA